MSERYRTTYNDAYRSPTKKHRRSGTRSEGVRISRSNPTMAQSTQTHQVAPYVIGVGGLSSSGKTTLCKRIQHLLSNKRVTIISQDSLYKTLTTEQLEQANRGDWNFDTPDAIDLPILKEKLIDLKAGFSTKMPVYDFNTHCRSLTEYETLYPTDVILVEGIFALYDESIRDLMDLKMFVDTDSDLCLIRRITRDITHRGRSLGSILSQYERFVKPAYNVYVEPQKRYADIIIPNGGLNEDAIQIIINGIPS